MLTSHPSSLCARNIQTTCLQDPVSGSSNLSLVRFLCTICYCSHVWFPQALSWWMFCMSYVCMGIWFHWIMNTVQLFGHMVSEDLEYIPQLWKPLVNTSLIQFYPTIRNKYLRWELLKRVLGTHLSLLINRKSPFLIYHAALSVYGGYHIWAVLWCWWYEDMCVVENGC